MGYRLEQDFVWSEASEHRNALTNAYEPLQPYVLKQFLEEFNASIFLDIGANIGYYSIIASGIGSIKEIYSFEPLDPAFSEILENIALNSLQKRIRPHKVAISSRSGTAKMGILSELSGANAILSTAFQQGFDPKKGTEVVTRQLDEIIQFMGLRIGVKIDVEGHEEEAVKGSKNILRNNKCVIQIELYDQAKHARDAHSRLKDIGYRDIFKIGPDVYMTNDDRFLTDALPAIENALALYVQHSTTPAKASKNSSIRRQIVRGVSVEFSPRMSHILRRIFPF